MDKASWEKPVAFFTKAYKEFPGGVEGLGWSSVQSQRVRFLALLDGIQERSSEDTILDVGCGYGDLSKEITWTTQYRGIDIVPAMIETAQQRYPNLDFAVGDIFGEKKTYDWVLASGTFNVKNDDNEKLLRRSIDKMWDRCRKGLIFNMLVKGSHVKNPEQYFYDAGDILDYCRGKTLSVVCRMDYMPHDAAFYLYRRE